MQPHHRGHGHQASISTITTGISTLLSPGNQTFRFNSSTTENVDRTPTADDPMTFDPTTKPCPGVSVEWTIGSHWATYPFLQHNVREVGWEPISFGPDNRMQF